MKITERLVAQAALAVSMVAAASAQNAFKVYAVPGSAPNSVTGINNAGQVMVNTATPDSSDVRVWTRQGGVKHLNLSGTNNLGMAIDGDGDIVGVGDPGSGDDQAFFWTQSGGEQWLGSLGGPLSVGESANNNGSVVGLSYTSGELQHAFFWSATGGMQDLTPDITTVQGAVATGINASDFVVGYYFPNGTRLPVGFTWTQAGGRQDFGATGTLPFAVSDAGTVVGQMKTSKGLKHAFSWTAAGGMNDLGTLGGQQSTALGINSNGWIVGTSLTNNGTGQFHGFLWTPSGGMKDLATLAGLNQAIQPYFLQVNDAGVIAMSWSQGVSLLIPIMTGTLTSSQNPSQFGNPVTFTLTMNSVAGAPPDGEIVQFNVGSQAAGTGTLSGGVAKFTTSTMAVGSHKISVNYFGDANYLPVKFGGLTQVVQ